MNILRLTAYNEDGSIFDVVDENDDDRGRKRHAKRVAQSKKEIVNGYPSAYFGKRVTVAPAVR